MSCAIDRNRLSWSVDLNQENGARRSTSCCSIGSAWDERERFATYESLSQHYFAHSQNATRM